MSDNLSAHKDGLSGNASAQGDSATRTEPFHPSVGSPGDVVVYVPYPSTSSSADHSAQEPISVIVPPASIHGIFAHRQWRAGMILADLICSSSSAAEQEQPLLPLGDRNVLELGAGTGLPGIMASLHNPAPRNVVITDYDEESLVSLLRKNVKANTSNNGTCPARVTGHIWGRDLSDVTDLLNSQDLQEFDVLLLADCLWDSLSHADLLRTLSKALRKTPEARAYVVSGLHTGRENLVSFIHRAQRAGLELKPWLTIGQEGDITVASAARRGEEVTKDPWADVLELRLCTAQEDEEQGDAETLDNGMAKLVSVGPRLTGHRRAFQSEERPDERKEVGGIKERNQWMTLWSLGWKQDAR